MTVRVTETDKPEGPPGMIAHTVGDKTDSVLVTPEVSTALTAKQFPAVTEATVVVTADSPLATLTKGPADGP